MARMNQELIDSLLLQQDMEFSTEFNRASHLLASTVSETPEAELLEAGEKLIDRGVASQRILGIRLLRELKQLAGKATSDMAGLLNRERDDDVIYWIASAFGFLRSDSVTSELIRLAAHTNPGVRYHVATALANRSSSELPDESLAALAALASDANAEVRFSAVFELGSRWRISRDPRIEAVLRNGLRDGDPDVVRTARDALGEYGEQ